MDRADQEDIAAKVQALEAELARLKELQARQAAEAAKAPTDEEEQDKSFIEARLRESHERLARGDRSQEAWDTLTDDQKRRALKGLLQARKAKARDTGLFRAYAKALFDVMMRQPLPDLDGS
jgi:hypothetical protein